MSTWFCCGFMIWSHCAVLTLTVSQWHCHFDYTQEGTLILCCHCKLCVCVHSLCVFAHLVFLRGACKSGKFLAQLVPAVSIPCVCVCVCAHLCVWVWGELKLCHDAATASGQVKPVTRHQMSEHNLCLGPSKNSCHVRWWGGGNIRIAR